MRRDRLLDCHEIAHWICELHAKELAKTPRIRGATHLDYFDPLAATCLGDLLFDRLVRQHSVGQV